MLIVAIIVRYKTLIEDSQTLQSVVAEFAQHPDLLSQIGVMIWDNSPSPIEDFALPFPVEYRTTGANVGVSGAYNHGLKFAREQNCPWMLLLDQDTALPLGFLRQMVQYATDLSARREIAAVAPIVADGGRFISPNTLGWLRERLVTPPAQGVQKGTVIPINSGALIRVSDLIEAGGFNEDFWLDYSDYAAFDQLQARGGRIYVAGDLLIHHKLSISDIDSNVSLLRYTNILYSEGSYWDLYRPFASRYLHTLRLFIRALRQYFRLQNKKISLLTFSYLVKRIFQSRRRRLREWRRISSRRDLPSFQGGKIIG